MLSSGQIDLVTLWERGCSRGGCVPNRVNLEGCRMPDARELAVAGMSKRQSLARSACELQGLKSGWVTLSM